MTTLLLAEHDNATLSAETAKALTAAKALGGPVHVLVAGDGAGAVAEAAASLDGVEKVLSADAPHLGQALAEPLAAVLHGLAGGYDAFVAPATAGGKNVMPRLAALLGVSQVSDVIEVVAPDTFKRPIYAGNAIQTVQALDAVRVLTIRTASWSATGTGAAAAPVETVDVPADPAVSRFVSAEISGGDRPELGSARVVVSGGRALGSKEKFDELILPLADALGGAVGASRAAVDSGYAPNDWQVGQTGKIVAPELYIAAGISGAIQHLAGMKDSRVVVAINKDDEAPIFEVADFGLVGDIFDILPELTKAVKGG